MSYVDRLKRNIIVFRFTMFFNSLLFFMPTWYAFETKFASPELLAVIYAVTHLVSVFLELPTGALADLIGRKYTMLLGSIIRAVFFIYLSQMQNATWLWIGYIFLQIGSVFISGADTALFYDTLKELKEDERYSEYASKNELIYRIGLTLASFIGGYIFMIHFRLPYILVGIATFLTTIATFFLTEPHIDSEKFTLLNYIKQTKIGFRELWKTPYVRDLSVYYISISGITWYYLYYLLNAYTTDVGFSPIARGWLSAVNSILVAVLGIMVAKKKLFSKQTTFIFFPIALVLGFLPAPFLRVPFAAIIIFIVYLASIFRWTFLDKYTNAEFESKYRATAVSTLSMCVSLIYFILTFLLNPIFQKLGSSWVMFSLGILTIITTVPTTIILLKKHKGR